MKKWISLSKIILLFVALSAGIAFGIYKNHQQKFQEVSIKLPRSVKISIYKDLGGDGPFNYDKDKTPLFILESSQKVELEKGIYDLVLDNPSNDYSNPVIKKMVDYGTTQIVVEPAYTDSKLASLLPAARPGALIGLYADYPLIRQNYTISKDALYGFGDWYGAVLQPKDPTQDVLKVMLHEVDNSWKMAVKNPDISIGKPANPGVPPGVLDQLDKL